jgi:HK97 family phage portal protein
MTGTGGAVWTPNDYENFAKEAYLKNVIAFACILKIARAVSSVPWGIYLKGKDNEILEAVEHPFLPVLTRANVNQSWSYMMLRATAFLCLSGNSFFEKITPDTGPNKEIPREIYALRPDRMQILTDTINGVIKGYKYSVGALNVVFERDSISGECNILHTKDFNPVDDFWGASPTEPAAREIDTHNESTKWNKALLENEGRPGMMFMVNGFLTDQQYDRLEKRLHEEYAGSANVGKHIIVEGDKGTDVKPYGYSPKDLEFVEGGRELARNIALAYGVPPMLLGIPGDNTYSNYKEARQAFWEDTVIYYLEYFRQELTNWLMGNSDNYLDYSLDNVAALAPKRESLWKMAQESNFLKINEKRALVGLPEVEGGDVILINGGMIPLNMAGELSDGTGESPTKTDGDAVKELMATTGMTEAEARAYIRGY